MRPVVCTLILLLALSAISHCASVSTGPWQLDTSLNESDSTALLGQLSFTLQSSPPNAWLISSSTLMLSNPHGIGPSATLFSSCDPSLPNCTSDSDLYQSVNGSLMRVAHLHSKDASIFRIPAPLNTTSESSPAAPLNESGTLLGSLVLPVSLPLEWLWLIALALVVLITVTFLVRNRD